MMQAKTELQNIHQKLITEKTPFVIYKLPGANYLLLEIGQQSGLSEFTDWKEIWKREGFVIAPFHRKTGKKQFIIYPIRRVKFELDSLPVGSSGKPAYNTDIQSITDIYAQQIDRYKSTFSRDFKKAILSKIIEIKTEGLNILEYFIKIAKNYPDAFVYYFESAETGTWLGASPETLISSQKGKIELMSLAGTSKTGTWTQKEIEEQKYVTEYILEKLIKFDVKDFFQSKTKNLKAGNIFHLMTKFTFDSKQINSHLHQFINELHPTPAVCGLPQKEALNLILTSEKHNREYYTGFLGPYQDSENFHFFVNLRCLKRVGEKLHIFVGGGITKDSKAAAEWDETEQKARTLLRFL
jgi:isochorismate synthase